MKLKAAFNNNYPHPPLLPKGRSAGCFAKGLTLALILLAGIILQAVIPCRAQGPDDAMVIDENGNVGIGTRHPEKMLDVKGTVKALGFEGDGAVPKGVIVMWWGEVDQIPAGWTLCDGSNGTPDLRSRFIVGAGSAEGGGYAPRSSGDPDKLPPITTATQTAGAHQHNFPSQYYARNFLCGVAAAGKKWCSGIDTRGTYQAGQPTQSAGNHTHAVTFNFNEANSGENRPRWFALCFIMKL